MGQFIPYLEALRPQDQSAHGVRSWNGSSWDVKDVYTKTETNSAIGVAVGAIDLSPYMPKAGGTFTGPIALVASDTSTAEKYVASADIGFGRTFGLYVAAGGAEGGLKSSSQIQLNAPAGVNIPQGTLFGSAAQFASGTFSGALSAASVASAGNISAGTGQQILGFGSSAVAAGDNYFRNTTNFRNGSNTTLASIDGNTGAITSASFTSGTGGAGPVYAGITSTFPGIWLASNATTPSLSNYALLSTGTDTILNAPSGNSLFLRIANVNQAVVSSTGVAVTGALSAASLYVASGYVEASLVTSHDGLWNLQGRRLNLFGGYGDPAQDTEINWSAVGQGVGFGSTKRLRIVPNTTTGTLTIDNGSGGAANLAVTGALSAATLDIASSNFTVDSSGNVMASRFDSLSGGMGATGTIDLTTAATIQVAGGIIVGWT